MDFNAKSLSVLRKQKCGIRKGARNMTCHYPVLECGSGVEALAVTHKAIHPSPIIIRLLEGAAPSARADTVYATLNTAAVRGLSWGTPCHPTETCSWNMTQLPQSTRAALSGVQGSSCVWHKVVPTSSLGLVLLGRPSCSSPLRECWYLTLPCQTSANISWAAKGTSSFFAFHMLGCHRLVASSLMDYNFFSHLDLSAHYPIWDYIE